MKNNNKRKIQIKRLLARRKIFYFGNFQKKRIEKSNLWIQKWTSILNDSNNNEGMFTNRKWRHVNPPFSMSKNVDTIFFVLKYIIISYFLLKCNIFRSLRNKNFSSFIFKNYNFMIFFFLYLFASLFYLVSGQQFLEFMVKIVFLKTRI